SGWREEFADEAVLSGWVTSVRSPILERANFAIGVEVCTPAAAGARRGSFRVVVNVRILLCQRLPVHRIMQARVDRGWIPRHIYGIVLNDDVFARIGVEGEVFQIGGATVGIVDGVSESVR